MEILGGVMNKDPDISAAPARVHQLLRWCLEKDRKKRLASISDARRLLDRRQRSRAGGTVCTATAVCDSVAVLDRGGGSDGGASR